MEHISPSTRKPDLPLSTYRLQLNSSFGFSDARRVIPTLHTLGITDCYVSSYLKAVHGSLHGYDIADPAALNPELGKAEVIAVVPRLVARLLREAPALPIGKAVWEETGLVLSPGSERRSYKNIFTGEILYPTLSEGRPVLPLAQIFNAFPVALLKRIETREKRDFINSHPEP